MVPRAKESFDLSAQQWLDRVRLLYGWDLQGLPERCDGCGKRFFTDHVLICMKGGLVGWGHNQFRDVMGEFSRKAWNNCTWEPVVREALQRAMDGGSDELTADFVVRGVWEPDRDSLFDTRIIIHAGSPGRATQHLSYQNALNTSAREKVKKYKAAAEERRATFCPLIVTVEGIAHQSVHAGLPQAHRCQALGKVAEAYLNGHQLGACPLAVRAHQSGGSADQGLQEEVEELGVGGWQGDCRSLPKIVGCAVFLFEQYVLLINRTTILY